MINKVGTNETREEDKIKGNEKFKPIEKPLNNCSICGQSKFEDDIQFYMHKKGRLICGECLEFAIWDAEIFYPLLRSEINTELKIFAKDIFKLSDIEQSEKSNVYWKVNSLYNTSSSCNFMYYELYYTIKYFKEIKGYKRFSPQWFMEVLLKTRRDKTEWEKVKNYCDYRLKKFQDNCKLAREMPKESLVIKVKKKQKENIDKKVKTFRKQYSREELLSEG